MRKIKLKPVSTANLIDGYMRLKNSDGKDSIYAINGAYWRITCVDDFGVYWLCYWEITDDNIDGDVYGIQPDFVLKQYRSWRNKEIFWGLSDVPVELYG